MLRILFVGLWGILTDVSEVEDALPCGLWVGSKNIDAKVVCSGTGERHETGEAKETKEL